MHENQLMILLAQAQGINYSLIEQPDLEELEDLLASVFSQFDPPAVAVGLSFNEVHEIVRLYGQRAPDDSLTVIARTHDSGKMVGAMLTDDFASPPPDHLDSLLSGHFQPIAALLEGLDVQYRRIHKVDPGKILHLFMLGVAPDFGGRGIAHTLVHQTLENGRRRGYERAITEATGKVSQHIFRKQGFIERFRIVYKDFLQDGNRPFETISDHGAVILLERDLRL